MSDTSSASPRGRLLSGTKAATRLWISYWALLRLIEGKRIAVVRTAGGRLMGLYESDCDEWVATHRTPAAGVVHEPSHLVHHDVDRLVDELVPAHERIFF